jgi:cytoskeletal protein RodZ
MNTGADFRSIRESRGLSLEVVAARTRIPLRMIEALEGNDLHTLPARPYARGFVTAYARELGLNATEVVPQYFSQFEPSSPLEPASLSGDGRARRRANRATAVAVATALTIALVVAAIKWWRPAARAPVETGATGGASGTIGPPAAVVAPETSAAGAVASRRLRSLRPSGELVVSLTFEQRCWIAVSVDGTRVLFQTMEAGATQTLTARREIVIRVGNAGLAKWSVNGRPPAPMGRMGEVRTIRLTADPARRVVHRRLPPSDRRNTR